MRAPLAILTALTIAGCESKSSEIAPTYVSPITYQSHSCQQLAAEAQRVSAAAATAAGQQDSQASKDAVATTVGVIVFRHGPWHVGSARLTQEAEGEGERQGPGDGSDRAKLDEIEACPSLAQRGAFQVSPTGATYRKCRFHWQPERGFWPQQAQLGGGILGRAVVSSLGGFIRR
jgi:hypothetical protein